MRAGWRASGLCWRTYCFRLEVTAAAVRDLMLSAEKNKMIECLTGKQRIAVVAAHPDHETMG
jgi:hypothetical protein